MTYAIVFNSRTGNTKQLAKAIKEVLPAEECVYFGEPDMEAHKADFIFVGFWTDKGCCDETITTFLCSLEHKKVALFGTAGMGGSTEYFNEIANRVSAFLLANCQQMGYFLCQGKMPMGVKRRYESILAGKPDDERIKSMIENFEQAVQHPNEEDLFACKAFVRNIIK